MNRRIVALALLLTGCPCRPTKVRTPLDVPVVSQARDATERAWNAAGLPPIDLSDVDVLVAEDCESFFRSCWPYRARGCPGETQVAAECAPTSDLVIISFSEPVADRPLLAIHGMLHDALRQHGPPDHAHARRDVWAQYGPETVEARARAHLATLPRAE